MAWSLPSRERGLKYYALHTPGVATAPSLPSRERGLKLHWTNTMARGGGSLPSRERGLKCTAERGCQAELCVAPFAGAWIEMSTRVSGMMCCTSLPSRERGLK